MINEGRCLVSVEELWITVVCPIHLHDIVKQLEAADWKAKRTQTYLHR